MRAGISLHSLASAPLPSSRPPSYVSLFIISALLCIPSATNVAHSLLEPMSKLGPGAGLFRPPCVFPGLAGCEILRGRYEVRLRNRQRHAYITTTPHHDFLTLL